MIDFVAGAFELCGLWCVGNKWRIGFMLNLVGGMAWIYVSIKMQIFGLLLVVVPAIVLNIRNYRKWSEDENRKTE